MPPMPRPRPVLIAYDFSSSADDALLLAIDLAARDPRVVLHVVAALSPEHGLPIAPVAKADYEYADQIRQRLVDTMTGVFADRLIEHEVHFFVHARIGRAAHEILQAAEELGVDLILVGSHGRTGVERALLGSVSEHVVREARCPVLVARPRAYADVPLLHIVSAGEPRHPYAKPHRYSYLEQRVQKRPDDWPLM